MLDTVRTGLRWLAGHGAHGESRFALTRWFAVVGALAIGVFSAGMGWLLSHALQTRMLERDAAISRDFVQSMATIERTADLFRVPHAGEALASPTGFFAHVSAMPDVLRANVYAPDGQVLWSSRAELIGQRFVGNEELDEALQGRTVVHLDEEGHEAPKAEHMGLQARSSGYVENYLPVFDEGTRRLLGVIEVYRQPAALFEAIASGQRLIWWGSIGGGAFLLLVLVGFVRRTEGLLQAQQARLVEAEALAMVGELSGSVAHSIRNPLMSIRSSAELEREISGDPGGVHLEIMRNVDRIEALVRTLLNYARAPAERQGSADLGAVLREAAAQIEPMLRAQGRGITVDIAPDLPPVAADPVLLAQVLNSLLANALEATGQGDSIGISAAPAGQMALITVSDSGSGIAAAQLADVFKPFFTTKARGLGMGLPLARRIVLRLGGRIALDSSPGQGTQVRLHLPLTNPSTPAHPSTTTLA
ncbi:sensor histidine kinase [Ideonella sp.]|uniref:sensor histidine kinase n=1 Tax=Ideonella sp. TaxID=1929293 RepID=UPI003BB61286